MINKISLKQKKKIIVVAVITLAIALLIAVSIICETNEEVEIIETEETTEEVVLEETSKPQIIVHITGCVKITGIVKVDENSRIVDVIEKAGGLTEEADISKVNLAYIVKDAQKIYIPSIYDKEKEQYISTESGENVIVDDNLEGEKSMINLNKATQVELEQLPGIGPSTALKIIKYKEENGNFKSIEDIKNVPGIGESKFNSIKDMIEV